MTLVKEHIGDNGLVCQCNINDRSPFEMLHQEWKLKNKTTGS
jgi:hypothetical protein